MTRGYGHSVVEYIYREVIRLSTAFSTTIWQATSFSDRVGLDTAFDRTIGLVCDVGHATVEAIRLSTSFAGNMGISVWNIGRYISGSIFNVARNIWLSCPFDLFRRED